MRNVLVTGGAGFIGSNFVRYLLATEPRVHVVNLDALTYAGSLENLRGLPDPERHAFVEGNICDRALVTRLLGEHTIDTVVHFAAESHVDRSISGPAAFIEANITGTFTLLEAARQAWLGEGRDPRDKRFHHISTDEVFGALTPDEPPFRETTPYAPNSPYSASKAAGDHLVRAYGHTYGLPVTISNCSNNYGPFQFPEKLIPLIVLNAVRGKALPVYGDGQQVRDWLYVRDHCEALRLILKHGRAGRTYNIGGDNQPTNLAIVREICATLDKLFPTAPQRPHASLIEFVTDRPGHDRRYAMDTSKITRELGWHPRHSLEQGLRKTVQWYVQHGDWLRALHERRDYQHWITTNYASRG